MIFSKDQKKAETKKKDFSFKVDTYTFFRRKIRK